MAGFFGLEWTNNATIEVIIESTGYNNSLAGYDNCPNANNYRSAGGNNATNQWVAIYLQNATARFQSMVSPEFNWTITDTYAVQTMCPYETVSTDLLDLPDHHSLTSWRWRMVTVHSVIYLLIKNGSISNIQSTFTFPGETLSPLLLAAPLELGTSKK